MTGMDIDIATRLAVFLKEYGGWAVASLAILALVIRDRDYRKSEREKYELALQIAPLTEKLMVFFQRASQRRRKKQPSPMAAHSELTDADDTPPVPTPIGPGAWRR